MKNIYYKVAHRDQAEIDSFKDRYRVFDTSLIPNIYKTSLGLTVPSFRQSNSWGTSHVVYFVTVKGKPRQLVLRANIGFGEPETVMLTEKLITDDVLRLGVLTNRVLYVDISRKSYPFDFQIQEMLEGRDLENHFHRSQSDYDCLSYELGQHIAKIHTLQYPGFGLFDTHGDTQ